MAQNITIMGASYSDVPAVQLPKTGGGTARFDDASVTTATASDVASGKVFLAADGTITTGTASGGGGNDFAVTIDWDDTQQMYVPDRTFAEIQSAYEAGKKIAVTMADNFLKDQYIADGYYRPSSDGLIPRPARFSYMVMYTAFPINTILYYMMNENELYYDGESNFYNTMDATATPADVASGKVFFNADGQQTGTGSLVTVSPLSVTQNGTYTAPSGTAYSPVTVNVSGGGGGDSAWTKVAETSYQVSTTSTSAITVATWATGHSELWTSDKIVYVRVRDTAGKRNGYFYGSDNFFINQYPKNGATTSSSTTAARYIHRYGTIGQYTAFSIGASNGYGVYLRTVYSDGQIIIGARYSSTYSNTIDGTYSVEVYLLDPPTGAPIFE